MAEANEDHRRRYLRFRWDDDDRFLRISGRLADAEGAVVAAALGQLAADAPPHPVTKVYEPFESRCADALVELASTRLATEAEADRAMVVIHTDPAVLGGAEGWAEIEGGPSIAAETARRLACDCRWQLVAEDDKGRALGLGRTTRQTPRWLARQVRRRDGGCRFPGCARKRWLHSHPAMVDQRWAHRSRQPGGHLRLPPPPGPRGGLACRGRPRGRAALRAPAGQGAVHPARPPAVRGAGAAAGLDGLGRRSHPTSGRIWCFRASQREPRQAGERAARSVSASSSEATPSTGTPPSEVESMMSLWGTRSSCTPARRATSVFSVT